MKTVEILKALADETRLRTFRTLAEAGVGLCVAEMADILRKPQYAVSRSLGELRKAGLLTEERQGKFVYYAVTDEPAIGSLAAWAQEHCRCDDSGSGKNSDGSSPPGAASCQYDSERLVWRLSLREQDKDPVTRPGGLSPDPRPRVLFVCIHNSARSQFAEEYLRQLAGDRFLVESAGLTPGELNPHVVAVLGDEGIDISQKATQSVADLFRRGETYQWVVTVCSREAEENCPVFPGPVRRLSWPFPDPAGFQGTSDEVRAQVRDLGQQIKAQVRQFLSQQNEKET